MARWVFEVTKLWTGQPERHAHLRSADFFDVAAILEQDLARA